MWTGGNMHIIRLAANELDLDSHAARLLSRVQAEYAEMLSTRKCTTVAICFNLFDFAAISVQFSGWRWMKTGRTFQSERMFAYRVTFGRPSSLMHHSGPNSRPQHEANGNHRIQYGHPIAHRRSEWRLFRHP